MAFYYNNKQPQNVYFNNEEVKTIIYNNVVVWKRLPKEYQELKYIESTGEQYIDTGVYGTEKTRIEIDYKYTDNTTSFTVLGNRINNKQKEFLLGAENNGLYIGYANSGIAKDLIGYSNYNISIDIGTRYKIIINKELRPSKFLKPSPNLKLRGIYTSVNINGTDYIVSNANITNQFITDKTISIFGGYKTENILELSAIRLYGVKIFDKYVIQRDLVPCYRKTDNKIGMYDIVNDMFYTNQGSGDFIKGNDV